MGLKESLPLPLLMFFIYSLPALITTFVIIRIIMLTCDVPHVILFGTFHFHHLYYGFIGLGALKKLKPKFCNHWHKPYMWYGGVGICLAFIIEGLLFLNGFSLGVFIT